MADKHCIYVGSLLTDRDLLLLDHIELVKFSSCASLTLPQKWECRYTERQFKTLPETTNLEERTDIKSTNKQPACHPASEPYCCKLVKVQSTCSGNWVWATSRAPEADLMSSHLSRRISAQLKPFLLITWHLKIDSGSKAISSSIPAVPKSQRACVTWQTLSKVPLKEDSYSEAPTQRISPVCNAQFWQTTQSAVALNVCCTDRGWINLLRAKPQRLVSINRIRFGCPL